MVANVLAIVYLLIGSMIAVHYSNWPRSRVVHRSWWLDALSAVCIALWPLTVMLGMLIKARETRT